MRTARLVGPTADGRSVVLVTDDGEELTVAIDPDDPGDPLARSLPGATVPSSSAVPAEPPPAGPPGPRRPPRRRETPTMDTPLSPRDIQQRIRAGESLEELVTASGMDPERVERFAAPVLAEREHMALTALSGSVRRRGESSGHRPLRTVVAERLLGQGVDADEVTWDAWKREDGQWQVSADFELLESERHAEFRFDPQGRFSLAEDDDARWLAGERPSPVAAVVDRDDELALVRATTELDEADLEVTEDLAAVLQVVPPAELSAEELAELAAEALDEIETPPDDLSGADRADEDGEDEASAVSSVDPVPEDARPTGQDAAARVRDEAAEPTIAVVRRLTRVTVEVDRDDEQQGGASPDAAAPDEARSALDTLYDMLGGDGYAEESTRVYAGLSDAAAVPVVDEHEFEAPAAVVVPAEPGPEAAEPASDAPEEPEARETPTEDTLVDLPAPSADPAPATADDDTSAPPAAQAVDDDRRPAAEAPPAPEVDEPLVPSPGAPRKPGRRKRASVPSWDEIMFGGPKPG
jgi:hypothetical protein